MIRIAGSRTQQLIPNNPSSIHPYRKSSIDINQVRISTKDDRAAIAQGIGQIIDSQSSQNIYKTTSPTNTAIVVVF